MPFGFELSGGRKDGSKAMGEEAADSVSSGMHVKCPVCAARHVPLQGELNQGTYACTCVSCGHFFKFKAVQDVKNDITFTVNGKQYTVGNEYHPATSILEYLRDTGISTGTKGCCYEGGCGMCLITVKFLDPLTQQQNYYTVNGCCLQLYTCDGMEITTVEGLGNTRDGLHPIQQRMAQYDGAQCGFCTPGQIVNMYGLLKNKGTVSAAQVEDAFDATICRCTGYRSILDAMKSLAVDAPRALGGGPIDIEEVDRAMCSKSGQRCVGRCSDKGATGHCDHRVDTTDRPVHIVNAEAQWFKPTSLAELYPILKQQAANKYRLVFGNSAFGVFRENGPWNFDVLVDIRSVKELYTIDMSPSDHITVGSNLSLTNLQDVFAKSTDPKLPYSGEFAKYITRIASNGLRNLVSWAGNLVMKNNHHDFASDVFNMFASVGATLNIGDQNGQTQTISVEQFLNLDLKGKVILSANFPKYSTGDRFIKLLKTSARLQLCHADVCSGFNFQVDVTNGHLVKSKPTIIVHGINGQLIHAVQTEGYLTGKKLEDKTVLKTALTTLAGELIPTSEPVLASPEYRKSLALGQFYKFILGVCKNKCNVRYVSGGPDLSRPVMTGSRSYNDEDPAMYPVSKPMMKTIENYLVTGEAKFVIDHPNVPGQLYAAPVLSTQGNADIKSIDPSVALSMPGVVAFIKASDIPGENNWRPKGWYPPGANSQQLLADKSVHFAGEPIGVIVATDRNFANSATFGVNVQYENVKPVVLDIEDGIRRKQLGPPIKVARGDAAAAIASAPQRVTGSVSTGDQYHFHLENQTAVAEMSDTGGVNLTSTTQWIDGVNEAVAQVMGIPAANVNVETTRLGGGFGGKILYNCVVSAMAALASHVTRKRVTMFLDIHQNMQLQGKRTAYYAEYEAGFDNNGKLLGVKVMVYSDTGHLILPLDSYEGVQLWIENAYYCENWDFTQQPVITNKQVSTACRAPASIQAMFVMETIMDHIATVLKKDQLQVRQLNFFKNGQTTLNGEVLRYCIIDDVTNQLINDINYTQRKQAVAAFNASNRWKKRGIHVMPNKFSLAYWFASYRTMVEVNHGDGSVFIAHGGIDMGQGINTKAIQTASYILGVPMNKIFVKKTTTTVNGNSFTSGGSVTSDVVCKSVIHCCQQILERMAPVRARLVNPTWEQLVAKCFAETIDLTAHYMSNIKDPQNVRYNVYSACCVEVEIDVLTGQYQILQMDYLYDCGQSLNPELDMGQVEGGFVMGFGYFMRELCKFNPTNGQLLNDGTWEYKPPLGKDLPIKFNIKFLKKNPTPVGVLRAKASGEPPVAMGAAPIFALKRAIESARAEIGNTERVLLNAPCTVEKVQLACMNNTASYTLGN